MLNMPWDKVYLPPKIQGRSRCNRIHQPRSAYCGMGVEEEREEEREEHVFIKEKWR